MFISSFVHREIFKILEFGYYKDKIIQLTVFLNIHCYFLFHSYVKRTKQKHFCEDLKSVIISRLQTFFTSDTDCFLTVFGCFL